MIAPSVAQYSPLHIAHLFNLNVSNLIWPGLFPTTYLLHLIEEYFGGEGHAANLSRTRGITFSSVRFLLLTSLGLLLMILGLILAYRFDFPQMMLVILGTTVLLNGLSHVITSLATYSYNPGLITGMLVWIPLGAITLVQLTGRMSGIRYLIAVSIGAAIQAVALLITLSGGRPIKSRGVNFALKRNSAIESGED